MLSCAPSTHLFERAPRSLSEVGRFTLEVRYWIHRTRTSDREKRMRLVRFSHAISSRFHRDFTPAGRAACACCAQARAGFEPSRPSRRLPKSSNCGRAHRQCWLRTPAQRTQGARIGAPRPHVGKEAPSLPLLPRVLQSTSFCSPCSSSQLAARSISSACDCSAFSHIRADAPVTARSCLASSRRAFSGSARLLSPLVMAPCWADAVLSPVGDGSGKAAGGGSADADAVVSKWYRCVGLDSGVGGAMGAFVAVIAICS